MRFQIGRLVVENAELRIGRYLAVMCGGVAYERWVRSEENYGHPNCLRHIDWEKARRITARSNVPKKEIVAALESMIIPLETIPFNADLVTDLPRLRPETGAVLRLLLGTDGIAISCATKLLYPKRRHYFPILDDRVCSVHGLRRTIKHEGLALRLMERCRQEMLAGQNMHNLQALRSWAESAPELAAFRPILEDMSLVRLFDIVLWMMAEK